MDRPHPKDAERVAHCYGSGASTSLASWTDWLVKIPVRRTCLLTLRPVMDLGRLADHQDPKIVEVVDRALTPVLLPGFWGERGGDQFDQLRRVIGYRGPTGGICVNPGRCRIGTASRS